MAQALARTNTLYSNLKRVFKQKNHKIWKNTLFFKKVCNTERSQAPDYDIIML